MLSVMKYNVDISGTSTALVKCVSNKSYVVECGIDRGWNSNLTTICTQGE